MIRSLKTEKIKIRVMKIEHHAQLIKLWKKTEGMGITKSDSKPELNKYLNRNRGFSFVALNSKNKIIGSVLCGHDGKRAFLYHLAVYKAYRRMGIGRDLVDKAMAKLRKLKLLKCTLFVYHDNKGGKKFWQQLGWITRKDLAMMQLVL